MMNLWIDESNHTLTTFESRSFHHQVRQVLVITLVLNLVVAAAKIVIGLWSGVLAITADGLHSTVDGSSNIIALLANRLAARPPDADHPYGHRRFETIAALGIGAFLLLTAWEILSSALARLSGTEAHQEITPLSFVVMLGTLGINLFVNSYESREGRRLNSELLIADAAHTRTDIWVTISVLVSMVLIALLRWNWLDTLVALVIVVLIVRAAWNILRQTGRVLVDTAPYAPEELAHWAEELPGVTQVVRARSRGPKDSAHIDLDVMVNAATTTQHTAAITNAIRDKLSQHIPGLDEVEVHFVPAKSAEPDYALTARARADELGLTTHEVHIRDSQQGKVLELHVEVPPDQTLGGAHAQVSQLEETIRKTLPDVTDVVSHIEPAISLQNGSGQTGNPDTVLASLENRATHLLHTEFPELNWHHLEVYSSNSGFALSLHVTLPGQISVEAAHRIAESAETLLRVQIPQIERVTIHTEPPE